MIEMTEGISSQYRSGVGSIIINEFGLVFVGKRLDSSGWQLPQGGVNGGESFQEALEREVMEEVGLKFSALKIIKESADTYKYLVPQSLSQKLWDGKYIGQEQKWFLLQFLGSDKDFNLNTTSDPEFCEWKWISPHSLESIAISFKKNMYKSLLSEFMPRINEIKSRSPRY